jgi:regulator of nucleoside diphosphate kinase
MAEQEMAQSPAIYVTRDDLDRLTDLLEAYAAGAGGRRFKQLESELARAKVVPRNQLPKDVVTMNSRVRFEDERTGEQREVTLVYPRDANIDAGKISILVPVGTALLGLRVGQTIDWMLPNGHKHRYRVIAVPHQPEATGTGG